MSAKIPFLPEGSQADILAIEWTPHMTERIRLWSRKGRQNLNYAQGASVNGGKHIAKLESMRNYDQKGVASDTFNNFIDMLTKVN